MSGSHQSVEVEEAAQHFQLSTHEQSCDSWLVTIGFFLHLWQPRPWHGMA
jgi:hypothetical protein